MCETELLLIWINHKLFLDPPTPNFIGIFNYGAAGNMSKSWEMVISLLQMTQLTGFLGDCFVEEM